MIFNVPTYPSLTQRLQPAIDNSDLELFFKNKIVPFRFRGLETIGVIFFLFNALLFAISVAMISLRFGYHPETFKASFLHPTERLFIPSAVVSLGTVLINISQYGIPKAGPWLESAVLVTFWIEAALACLASSGIYLAM